MFEIFALVKFLKPTEKFDIVIHRYTVVNPLEGAMPFSTPRQQFSYIKLVFNSETFAVVEYD